MALLVESVKYVAIKTTNTATNGCCVIMFVSKSYTLQDKTTIDGQIITAANLFLRHYIFLI